MPVTKYAWARSTTEPYLHGNLISQDRGGQSSYFHFDGIGNMTEATDDTGNVTATRAYTAFGDVSESTGETALAYQFVGQKGYYYDEELGQYSVRRRSYEVGIARWMSPDLRVFARGRDLYVYVLNNPRRFVDPAGLEPEAPDDDAPKGGAGPLKITIKGLTWGAPDCPETGEVAPGVLYDFILSAAADCKDGYGYFIQKITKKRETGDCTKCESNCPDQSIPKTIQAKPYWEAWRVTNGQTVEDERVPDPKTGKPKRDYTDASADIVKPNTCGKTVTHGEVRFYCGEVTGDLEKGGVWIRDNPDTEAGELLSTTGMPAWWKGSKQQAGPASRFVAIWWCCCTDATKCPNETRDIKVVANPEPK